MALPSYVGPRDSGTETPFPADPEIKRATNGREKVCSATSVTFTALPSRGPVFGVISEGLHDPNPGDQLLFP